MLACALHEIGRLVCGEVPDPVPAAGEALLKIKASGVCGSDIPRVFSKGTYKFPTVPGHEFAGEIVRVGDGVDGSLVGKAAAVFPLLPCRSCEMCEAGEYALCRDYDYFGSRRDGGFAEYASVPLWNLVFCDGLSYEELAMAEPAAVSVHALGRAGVSLGDVVAIFGAGAIGLMLAAFAHASGAGETVLFDIDEKRLDFAKKNGYAHAYDCSGDGWRRALDGLTSGRGADIVVEGAGVSASVENCLKAAKPLGKVVLMGNPSGGVSLRQEHYWEILRKQLTIYGTWNSDYTRTKNDWKTAVSAMASGAVDLKPLVTHRFPLSECAEAFEFVRDRTNFSCRVMFVD